MRYHLNALDQDEMLKYIQHRMRIAGRHHTVRFSSRAMGLIYRYSGGVPRLVNLLCDRALITAFTMETNKIAANIIMAAIREIEGPEWTFKNAAAEEKATKSRKSFLRLPFFANKTR